MANLPITPREQLAWDFAKIDNKIKEIKSLIR